jgi:hypothetical protein
MTDGIPRTRCFVALFDILGYKDLVRRNDLTKVFNAHMAAIKNVKDMIGHLEAVLRKNPLITIRTFSDTFLIYTSDISEYISNQEEQKIDQTFQALLAACDSLFIAANENKLPIRGAITEGELIVSDGIEIGEPIIDAYEMEQKQEWIGCWIAKKCIDLIGSAAQEHLEKRAIVQYEIPCKEGSVEQFYSFNWLLSNPFIKLESFDLLEKKEWHDWSAERKHRNTWKFINFIRSGNTPN